MVIDLAMQIRDEIKHLITKNAELQQQVAELTADAHRWADAANEQRLVAMEQANKVRELTAERDELSNTVDMLIRRIDGLFSLNNLFDKRIKELEAEVETQRKRANDAERGVLSNEWYVARDRYEDDVAALTAERDKYEVLAVNAEQWKNERDQLSKDLTAEHALVAQFEHDNEQLREHAADLTAEIIAARRKVDELREAIDAMGNGQFYAMYRAKCDECEQLKEKQEKGGKHDDG